MLATIASWANMGSLCPGLWTFPDPIPLSLSHLVSCPLLTIKNQKLAKKPVNLKLNKYKLQKGQKSTIKAP